MKYTLIGLSDQPQEVAFSEAIMQAIRQADAYCGGKRHHELVGAYLQPSTPWIDITVPIRDVFDRLSCYQDVVVFASGDPFFYGFGQTIQRLQPEAAITVYPTFNSLQQLAHRLLLPYQEMKAVSLTGRPWDLFDASLIHGEKLLGMLTDHHKTPVTIAQRMVEYGYDNYKMFIGEALGNPVLERITEMPVAEVALLTEPFRTPNCLFLQRTSQRPRLFGIPESDFALLDGRARMITKMPIRLLSLSMLDLSCRGVLWDVGFCTGSVSIEAKSQFPELKVVSFEQRPECEAIIAENMRRHGTPGIQAVIGDFLTTDITPYPAPDAVFIGGHGGKLEEMVDKIRRVLRPDGVIVFNSVSTESLEAFRRAVQQAGMTLTATTHITIDDFNPITIMKAENK